MMSGTPAGPPCSVYGRVTPVGSAADRIMGGMEWLRFEVVARAGGPPGAPSLPNLRSAPDADRGGVGLELPPAAAVGGFDVGSEALSGEIRVDSQREGG